jgi:predicted O-methyltransferase YrrM
VNGAQAAAGSARGRLARFRAIGPAWFRVAGLLGLDDRFARETVYAHLLDEALAAAKLDVRLFPAKRAGNHSLLYLVCRIIDAFGPASVLELGAGETTKLLAAFARGGRTRALTLESDPDWARRGGRAAGTDVAATPLVDRTVRGHAARAYDPGATADRRFDMVIVDGPAGARRRSRWGALEVLDRHLNGEFVVVFDDVHRRGEVDTVLEAWRLFDEKGIAVRAGLTRAAKWQLVMATGRFAGAAWL